MLGRRDLAVLTNLLGEEAKLILRIDADIVQYTNADDALTITREIFSDINKARQILVRGETQYVREYIMTAIHNLFLLKHAVAICESKINKQTINNHCDELISSLTKKLEHV